jgi:hypothetical protein
MSDPAAVPTTTAGSSVPDVADVADISVPAAEPTTSETTPPVVAATAATAAPAPASEAGDPAPAAGAAGGPPKQKVARIFTIKTKKGTHTRPYLGTVVDEWTDPKGASMWSIQYFDGDTEDMNAEEFQAAVALYEEIEASKKAKKADAKPPKTTATPTRKSSREPTPRKEVYSVPNEKKTPGKKTLTKVPTSAKKTRGKRGRPKKDPADAVTPADAAAPVDAAAPADNATPADVHTDTPEATATDGNGDENMVATETPVVTAADANGDEKMVATE